MAKSYPLNSTSPSAMPAVSTSASVTATPALSDQSTPIKRVRVWVALAAVVLLFLALTSNLTRFPTTWFDEGSHLHVPKTLVMHGVYADYSSEGFRYYGPTIGVGPTVMLPIAAVFSLFGIGLLQARLVIVTYLVASIVLFYVLARRLGSTRFALIATALLLTSQSVSLIEYGRQVLGEVPALVFMLLGVLAWQSAFTASSESQRQGMPGMLRRWLPLVFVGLMFGLTTITKNQFLLVIAPSLGVSWLVCAVFLRWGRRPVGQSLAALPHSLFWVPLITMLACYGVWQVWIVLYLGPSNVQENFRILREATAGAAFVFSTDAMWRATRELLSQRAYAHLLVPALAYAGLLVLMLFKRPSSRSVASTLVKPLDRNAHFWLVMFIFIVMNFAWYVVASIGWVRYAFPGLVLSALLVARFLSDLTDGFALPFKSGAVGSKPAASALRIKTVLGWGIALWAAAIVLINGANLVQSVVSPPPPAAQNMAAYMDHQVPLTASVETWEPEMGFLTDHRYHFPPNALLSKSVNYMWSQGPAPSTLYNFMEQTPGAPAPDYVLLGEFGRWVGVYPQTTLDAHYRKVAEFGTYALYALAK